MTRPWFCGVLVPLAMNGEHTANRALIADKAIIIGIKDEAAQG
jgi:hypothetical protein